METKEGHRHGHGEQKKEQNLKRSKHKGVEMAKNHGHGVAKKHMHDKRFELSKPDESSKFSRLYLL